MKDRNFLMLLLVLVSLVQAQSPNSTSFELNGTITNEVPYGTKIFLNYTTDNVNYIKVSADIIDNKFVFKGNISNPVRGFISNGDQFSLDGVNSGIIYLEPKKMEISLNLYNFKDLKLKGSKTQDEYTQLEEIKTHTSKRRDSISICYGKYFNEIKNSKDTLLINNLQKEIYNLDKIREEITNEEVGFETEFIKQNPTSFVSLELLRFRLLRREMTFELANTLFNSLLKEVQNCEQGKILRQTIENFRNSKTGSIAPDFTAEGIDNEKITLSSFRGKKYILIDFWASWCSPCREDLPLLKSLYSKYSEKGLEIISISTDINSVLWKNAIAKEEIQNWKHISIAESKNPLDTTYVVSGIPVKILIDKEGKIIGRWKGKGLENETELKKLLEENIKE